MPTETPFQKESVNTDSTANTDVILLSLRVVESRSTLYIDTLPRSFISLRQNYTNIFALNFQLFQRIGGYYCRVIWRVTMLAGEKLFVPTLRGIVAVRVAHSNIAGSVECFHN